MLEFYDIVFTYGKKNVNNSTLSKVAFIAFIRNVFSKKTQITLIQDKKMAEKRLNCVLLVF